MPPPDRSSEIGQRFPARFDPDAFAEDLARTTATGRATSERARAEYERDGVPRSQLQPCDAEGRDGTSLPGCLKVYLPQPIGRFGMVFEVVRTAGKLELEYLAFGVRHQPHGSNAPTVYELAGARVPTQD
jgi:hypothetical protein